MRHFKSRPAMAGFNKRICSFLLTVLLCVSFSLSSAAEIPKLEDMVRYYTGVVDGVKHDYIVDLPDNPRGAPVVLVLHGYGGSAEAFRQHTGFYKEAVSQGYIVVHVSGTPAISGNPSTNGWNYRDYGQRNSDVIFLTSLAAHIIEQYHANGACCFAVGYSNGAFMCHRLALDPSHMFTAVVSVEGAMSDQLWARRPARCSTGIFQITGENDRVVPKKSDKNTKHSSFPDIEDVMTYYAQANGLSGLIKTVAGRSSELTMYKGYGTGRQVWHLVVDGGSHFWSAEGLTGINTNEIVLDYLNTYVPRRRS